MSFTFTQVVSLWKTDKRKWIKASSYATYIQIVNKRILPFFRELRPEQLNEETIQHFADTLLSQGMSFNSTRDALMVLKMILNFGEKLSAWPHITYDVHFPTCTEQKKDVPVLSEHDQRKLIRYLQKNFSFRNLGILVCLYSGLRIGEVCALQWKDVDIPSGVIHVSKTVHRIWLSDGDDKSYMLSVGAPKTASSFRDIPICGELMKTLRPLRKITVDEYYIISNAAMPLEPRYYRDYFRKTLLSIGIHPIRFHALRHTFATRCIESKCDYKTVSVILGHASLATTMDLYVHPGLSEQKKAIEKMSRMFKSF